MKELEFENQTGLKFDESEHERLLGDFCNAVGNIDRYLVACGLKESEIGCCMDINDYLNLIMTFDDVLAEKLDNEPSSL